MYHRNRLANVPCECTHESHISRRLPADILKTPLFVARFSIATQNISLNSNKWLCNLTCTHYSEQQSVPLPASVKRVFILSEFNSVSRNPNQLSCGHNFHKGWIAQGKVSADNIRGPGSHRQARSATLRNEGTSAGTTGGESRSRTATTVTGRTPISNHQPRTIRNRREPRVPFGHRSEGDSVPNPAMSGGDEEGLTYKGGCGRQSPQEGGAVLNGKHFE